MKTSSTQLRTALGPLAKLFFDKKVSEIFVDHFDDVYFESRDGINAAKSVFKSENETLKVANALLKFAKKKVEKEVSTYDIDLDESSKAVICLPPVSKNGARIVITKIPEQNFTWEDMIQYDAIRKEGVELIEKLLNQGKNIVAAGTMGSGKTTLANLLINSIPLPMRVITLEPFATLKLNRKMTCQLESATKDESGMKELFKAAHKMRADYLVVNQLETEYINDYVKIIRDGHSGLAVANGENIFDVIKKIEVSLLANSVGLSIEDARHIIAQVFEVIVFQAKMEDGYRRVTHIAEVHCENGELKYNILYKY